MKQATHGPNIVSTPEPGAVEHDFTHATLVLDMENTLGESFHWEVPPDDRRELPTRNTDSAADKRGKVFVLMTMQDFFHQDVAKGMKT